MENQDFIVEIGGVDTSEKERRGAERGERKTGRRTDDQLSAGGKHGEERPERSSKKS